MKFFNRFFLFIFLFSKSFSYNIDDYSLFQKAYKLNKEKNYSESKFFYDIYEKNFNTSYPLTSNFAKYYIAKNYMDLEQYDKALLYFSRAVYVPEEYVLQETKKTNFFQYRRDYYSGEIYQKKGDEKTAFEFFKRLVLDYYDIDAEPYEKKALTILGKKESKYKIIYDAKYNNNLQNIGKLDSYELSCLGKYFFDKKDYTNSKIVLEKLESEFDKNNNLKTLYLETLLKLNENKKVIELTTDTIELKYILLRGVAFEKERNYSKAIFNYKKLEKTEFKDIAAYRTARIYYLLERYNESISILESMNSKNEFIDELLLDNYVKTENKSKFINFYKQFRDKYPNNPTRGLDYMIYTNLLNNEKNPWNIGNYSIFYISNYTVRDYIDSHAVFQSKDNLQQKILSDALIKIGELGNPELLELAIKSNTLGLQISTLEDKIIVIDSFAKNKFYKEAFEKSVQYSKELYQYKNLLPYLFPEYYKEEVENSRKKTLLPKPLIYTVIYLQSFFDKTHVEFNRIGLMGVPKNIVLKEEELFEPQKNIDIGTKLLKEIYEKNNKMTLKTLIEYIYGKEILNRLNFELDGDIKLETIRDYELQKKIENIVFIYAFYSALYN